MSNFFICLAFLLFAQVALLLLHPIFITQLEKSNPGLFDAVSRPSVSYFASGSFFSFGPFARWLISFRVLSQAGLPKHLKVLGAVESLLFLLLVVAWLAALFTWVVGR